MAKRSSDLNYNSYLYDSVRFLLASIRKISESRETRIFLPQCSFSIPQFFPPLLHHITPTQAEDRGLCFDNSFFWQPGQIDSEPDTFVSQAANQKTIFSRLISSISLSPTPQQQKPCRSLARAKTGAGMCKWWNYSGSVSCRGVKEISRLFYTFWHLFLLKPKLEIGMLVCKIKIVGMDLRIIDKRLIFDMKIYIIYLSI